MRGLAGVKVGGGMKRVNRVDSISDADIESEERDDIWL
jgi:hypothetical protein